jgi:hypothetical protein
MESNFFVPESPPDLALGNSSAGRTLQERVTAAAEAILEQGLRPTVTRVRAAMGGGSPNDIGPALKHWKDALLPAQGRSSQLEPESVAIPPILTDVVRELWSRALAAAAVEIKGGASARLTASQGEQVHLLRQENASLRDRLQREQRAYGELRAQSARHEVIARDALSRAAELETRLSESQRALGGAQAAMAQLEAELVRREVKRAKSKRRSKLANGLLVKADRSGTKRRAKVKPVSRRRSAR